jgi:8-oxo-dGTP pyrophosphatase MutT (NUDIX family)
MSKAWRNLGKIAFWLSWPLLFFYLRMGKRTRVLIVYKDEIVVTRGWLGAGQWALPGGGIHRGEDASAGAVREVSEETGLNLDPAKLQHLGNKVASEKGLKFVYEEFVVHLDKKLPLRAQRLEITDIRWIPINELSEKNAENVTLAALKQWKTPD